TRLQSCLSLAAQRTCSTGEFACNGTACVPMRWVCDGDNDCDDGSDEEVDFCHSMTCKANQFSCGPGSACIPLQWQCDGESDCPNGQDEQHCNITSCDADQFRCKSDGKCITNRWVCDYDADCDDKSDELDCPARTCPPENFMCNNGRCVPGIWKCDGDRDCTDGEDEENCQLATSDPSSPCSSREFTCADKMSCIHIAWRCDGDPDCQDESDEIDCHVTCGPSQFTCTSPHKCIPQVYQCDGLEHCLDGSDEAGCPSTTSPGCNSSSEFDCFGTGMKCIPLTSVCDKVPDCQPTASPDELVCKEVNPCKTNNGGCADKCIFNYNQQFHCECSAGFQLAPDNKTCIDVNECNEFGRCSQICVNTEGSYHCKCEEGYIMDPVLHYCKADGEEPSLLFANRIDLREYRLHSGEKRALVEDTKSTIALDFDYANHILFWSDVSKEQINMTIIEDGEMQQSKQTVITRHVRTPDGLAFDWVHRNLYWTDTGHNTISVVGINFDGEELHHKTLFNTNLDEPRAIVVDPRPKQGWMYWSDWGEPAKIEKAGLHGDSRKVIVQSGNTASHLEWPNGLTIDYTTNRLYWVDAKLQVIGTCNLQGGDQRIILSNSQFLKHPFAITVFEDFVYWSDWGQESIHRVNKYNGQDVSTTLHNLHSPMDVHVYHRHRQPEGFNVCAESKCSHLCLPVPHISDNSAKFICACPDSPSSSSSAGHFKMAADGLTCIRMSLPLIISTNCSFVFCSAEAVPVSPTDTIPVSTSTSSPQARAKDGGQNVGKIAGIVVTILLVVLLVLLAGGVLFYRSYTRKNINSMNFDNPVYRKTTEDQFSLEKN
ncbi:hypothetical protein CAPTEDRAFT_62161, partial [Capitella teleta]